MKKVMFSAAILAFAGITALSASNHPITINNENPIVQDTTGAPADTTAPTPTDTTSTPADTTSSN